MYATGVHRNKFMIITVLFVSVLGHILKVHKLELQIALTVWGQALVWHMHAYTQSSCYVCLVYNIRNCVKLPHLPIR